MYVFEELLMRIHKIHYGETWKILINPAFAYSVDQMNWSGSALFAIKYVNLQQSRSSNLIGWKLEVGVAS